MIEVEEDNIRIDTYLREKLNISRSKIQKLIKQGKILVNDKEINNRYIVNNGDKIIINDELDFDIPLIAEDIAIDVIYEDEYLLIINKESGMVVHPAPGHYTNTLVNALLYRFSLSNDNLRPGIVHRLDKDTSGLMLVAKNDEVHDKLANMIKNKDVKRHYLAIVEGVIAPETGTIDAPIGRDLKNREKMTVTDVNAKSAVTHFKVLKRYKKHTLVECILETGRTHQIRVHMAYIKHPIVNDPLYNNNKATEFGQMLHSKSIELKHPILDKTLYYEQKPPEEFQTYITNLENNEEIN